jgi:putative transposase
VSRQTSVGTAPVTLVCETFAVSRSSFYAASQAARAPRDPDERRRRPARAGVPATELVAAIHAVVEDHPAWGHRKVWATLRRRGLRVGRRRVYETMRSLGLTLPATHPGRKAVPRGHVAVAEPNRRIATDLTVIWTRDGGLVPIVITVDCGCRSVLDVTVTDSQTAFDVLLAVERGLLRAFGAPQLVPDGVELRSDHGPQFTGHDAAALARRWGIEQTFAPVGRPTGNAVAERTIQTMKVECLWIEDFVDAAHVQCALDRWRHDFNHERPHQALDWRTPAETRALHLGLDRAVA